MTSTYQPESDQRHLPSAGRTDGPGKAISIVGVVLGALALIFGVFTGLPGLVCGIIGAVKGNRLGYWAIAVSIIGTAAGIAIGAAVLGD